MTIEILLGYSADQLEKLSDKELADIFEPQLNVTRPERAAKLNPSPKHTTTKPTLAQINPAGYNKAKQYMMEVAGIDLDDL